MPSTTQSRPSKFLKNDNIILDQKFISFAVYFLGKTRNGRPKTAIIAVINELFKIIQFLYIGGTLFVTTSLTIRCLRNVGAKWQWIFLHFIPLGFILIYFFPLKKEKK